MIQYRSMTTAFSSPCSSDLQHQLMSYNEKDAYLLTTAVGGDSSPSSTRSSKSSSLSPRAPEEDLESMRDDAQSQHQQQQQQQVKQWSYEEQFRQVNTRTQICYIIIIRNQSFLLVALLVFDFVNCLFLYFFSCTTYLPNRRERNFWINYSTICKRKVK